MVNNSTNINKANNHLSPQIIKHRKDHDIQNVQVFKQKVQVFKQKVQVFKQKVQVFKQNVQVFTQKVQLNTRTQ